MDRDASLDLFFGCGTRTVICLSTACSKEKRQHWQEDQLELRYPAKQLDLMLCSCSATLWREACMSPNVDLQVSFLISETERGWGFGFLGSLGCNKGGQQAVANCHCEL